ncbi:hypothetical protein PSAC2689_30533 [Paraburkholderia sacchari]
MPPRMKRRSAARESGRVRRSPLFALLMPQPKLVVLQVRMRERDAFLNDGLAPSALFIEFGMSVIHHGLDFGLPVLALAAQRDDFRNVAHVDGLKIPADALSFLPKANRPHQKINRLLQRIESVLHEARRAALDFTINLSRAMTTRAVRPLPCVGCRLTRGSKFLFKLRNPLVRLGRRRFEWRRSGIALFHHARPLGDELLALFDVPRLDAGLKLFAHAGPLDEVDEFGTSLVNASHTFLRW